MKTAKQEHDANIFGLRRLCYGWILSPVRMVAHVFNMRAMHVTLLRFTLRILRFPWCGGGLISLSLAVAEIICFVQKRRFEIVYFVHLVS